MSEAGACNRNPARFFGEGSYISRIEHKMSSVGEPDGGKMDELTRKAHAAADRWIATLTPEQRALAKVGALKPEHMTPHQQKLCEEISNYIPKGMNTEQIREWGRITTLEENREKFQSEFRRGWNDADKQINKVKWICFALGCCIAILILLRC